ncbi:DMT family transporter [Anabaenopsis tanganyikae CS-531]|uniref:DMT family transporter n=2 Tax=Anabaenopsis TaxID=110103 RepID=A0ABT5ASD6_9CYAN|nr:MULTISPECIES: DMT family transporter [Anabaenopsis]MDB9539346.1 DMT family transporter [Anabaenopsis arnoldii]MDH6091639.1 DMT family transporter [Anabaenopsis arnoldii]MDH6104980.1 DMT family transporter [Anabaenopsis tanganyikae CS-531]
MHQSSGRWRLGLGLSLLTVWLWGILPIALTISLRVLDVYTIIWFRFLLSFVVLAVLLGLGGKLPDWQKLRSSSGVLLAIATLFLGFNYLLFMQGLAFTSAGNAEVLIQLAPLLLSLGGLVIFRERYTVHQWIGVSILTAGYMIFFHEQLSLITVQGTYILGSGLIVLGSAAWAIYALCQKQLLNSLSSAQIMVIIYGGCAVLFTPFAQPGKIVTLSSSQLLVLLFCGLNTLIAYGAFAESLQHWPASRVSAVLAIAPIITLIAVATLSTVYPTLMPTEHLTVIGILGALLVVTGSVAIALGKGN